MNISLLIGLKNNLDYTKNFYNTTRQLYPNVELCFVSYGSTDGTDEWLDSLNDENVKYFYSEESKTFSDTFNKAASLATKDYVMFLHNDIVVAPNFLENVEKHLSPDSIISYTTIEPPIFAGHERPGKIIKDFGTDINTFQLDDMYTFSDIQREVYRDKTEQGITFFMCMPKDKYLEIGGLHNIFNPMFCEDDDLILRWKLLGMNLFTSLDSICYHFVSKTSRFSKDYQTRTQQIEQHSNKNFVRKWGFRNSIHNKKYNIHSIIHNCNHQLLEILEPWFTCTYTKNTYGFNWADYRDKEQDNTSFDMSKRVADIDSVDKDAIDILVEFDAREFNQNTFNIIQNLSDIITESGEIGEFQLDCLNITIKSLKTYENELIRI